MSSLKLRSMKSQQESQEAKNAFRLPTAKEQWCVSLASLWFFTGLFMDGWAHNHLQGPETFFTPWHAVFYSGYLATSLTLLYMARRNATRLRLPFRLGVPEGYGLALVGAALFAAGGIGDLVWHEVFGIESGLNALLSPAHLLMAFSMFLLVSANVAVWFRTVPPIGMPRLARQLPMLLSLAMSLGLVSFMTQFSHFASLRVMETSELVRSMAVSGYLLQSALYVGAMLLILSRGRLAAGAWTLVMSVSLLPMAFMRDGMLLAPLIVLAGMLADMCTPRLHPLEQRRKEVRIFSFLFPAMLFAGYFLTAFVKGGIAWSTHAWTGSVVMSGLAGLLAGVLVLPPVDRGDA